MTKKCPQCGKRLPLESNFCPYCMTKLIEEKEIPNTSIRKPKRRKWIVYIAVAVLLIATEIARDFLQRPKVQNTAALITSSESANKTLPSSSTVPSSFSSKNVPSSDSPSQFAVDYNSYVGKWYDEPSINKSDIEIQGGNCLQIVSVSGNQMVFSLMSVTEPPGNRIAKIDNVAGQISGNDVFFAFTDDGWGNAGKGALKLKNGEIYAKVTITTPNSVAQMSLSMQCYFKKVKETISSEPIELSQILTYFPDIRGRLGEETQKSFLDDNATGIEVHVFGAVEVFVDFRSDTVKQFLADFTKPEAKMKYTFDDLDGTVTYNKLISKYGASKDVSSADGEKTVGYNFKQKSGYYVKYTFDSDGKLKNIYCFSTDNGE